jgi:hypothetical protein
LDASAATVNFANAFTGDIFIVTEYPTIGQLTLNFNQNYSTVAAGTNFRLKNGSGVKITMFYDKRYAFLPNIDDENTGSFDFAGTDSILFVKADLSATYYKVN